MQKKLFSFAGVGFVLFIILFTYYFYENSNNKISEPSLTTKVADINLKKQNNSYSLAEPHSPHDALAFSSMTEVINKKSDNNLLQKNASKSDGLDLDISSDKRYVERALRDIPINYHNIFSWNNGNDNELLRAYYEATEVKETEVPALINEVLAVELSNFIYQHELSPKIALEYLRCSSEGCVIYGVELDTGIWNQVIESAKNQPWWGFLNDSTRASVGSDGNLIFFTVIR
ncbi:MAG: hypothetical protein ACJAUY_000699 [Cognaticolwellia sp.]|jgi:hypothetical protein